MFPVWGHCKYCLFGRLGGHVPTVPLGAHLEVEFQGHAVFYALVDDSRLFAKVVFQVRSHRRV